MIVGIVILAAAAAGIGKLFRTSEISTEAANITQMAANLRSLKNGANGYTGLDTKLAVQYKAVPANMSQTSAGVVKNSWNGDVTIGETTTHQEYTIEYANVPDDACMQLVQKLANAGWSKVEAGGKTLTPTSSLSDIQAGCTDPTANAITFTSAN
ncbi:type IV prepilin [Luteibacter jiangsuensis]|uniref:Type IV prepilin n=2 Tax=Rhodanobacteraceae TaxID=1775411 RepID=A0ABX0Q2J9_9GAMM|nr:MULTISPECIES: type 4 pilus major pilin [Luteibacter]NID04703.1 type IV prepilin [Luteibacter jiangsuensis]